MKIAKTALLAFATLLVSAHALAAKPFRLDWQDESATLEVSDEGVYEIILPFVRNTDPTAEIRDESLATCEILDAKKIGKNFVVRVDISNIQIDDGFNGCTIELSRNGPQDEDGIGIVTAELGFFVHD